MNKKMLITLYEKFNNYVASFYGNDELVNQNIKLKEEHTHRVCTIIKEVATSVQLSETSMLIAESSAILHDIGRFEQFKTYKTFSDNSSINHATLGLKIIDDLSILSGFTNEEKLFIKTAVKYHNTKAVPEEITGEFKLFCELIRDSDKLDIFYVISQHEKQKAVTPNPALDNLPNEKGYSQEIATAILNNEKVSYELIKNSNDRKLLELGWILDINFPYSINYYNKCGYLETFTSYLPKTKEIELVYSHLRSYIDNRLS